MSPESIIGKDEQGRQNVFESGWAKNIITIKVLNASFVIAPPPSEISKKCSSDLNFRESIEIYRK
jgi:hypothetical protein